MKTMKSFLSINKPCQLPELLASGRYGDGLGRIANRGISHSLAILDPVNDQGVTAIRRIGGPITGCDSVCICERAKVETWIWSVNAPIPE